MSYNGWDNFETWKFNLENLERFGSVSEYFEMLGYQLGDDEPTEFEIAERLKEYAFDYLDSETSSEFAKDWARVALDSINWLELAEHLLKDAEFDDEPFWAIEEIEEEAEELPPPPEEITIQN